MKKKTVVSVMVVAMLFAVSLFFVGGTYARYADKFTGTGSVEIAKWAVKLAEGSEGKNMTLKLTPDAAPEYVVNDKIAPSYSASAKAEINLNGTEVAVGVIAEADKEQLAQKLTALGFVAHSDDIQLKLEVKGKDGGATVEPGGAGTSENPYVIKLTDGAAFGEEDVIEVTIKVTWDNAEDANNEEHTSVGTKGGTLEIPVNVHVFQYIDANSYNPAA